MRSLDAIAQSLQPATGPPRGLAGLLRATDGMTAKQAEEWICSLSEESCKCGRQMSHGEGLGGCCGRCGEAREDLAENPVNDLQKRRAAGIPERFLRCSLASWRGPIPAAEKIEAWKTCEEEPLLIYGPNGTGKTHLATALLVEKIEKEAAWGCWVGAKWAEAALTDEVRASERPIWRRLLNCRYLLLDEVGDLFSERGLDRWGAQQIDLLITERYNQQKPIIATANLTDEQLYKGNSRLGSRLAGGIRVSISGKDRRLFE